MIDRFFFHLFFHKIKIKNKKRKSKISSGAPGAG
jgi:hypothetical protein